ncbi:hypothetical protein A2Y99_05245 [Candidatus Gottesmanbacteria bacterium RBG_13_37_7]|uniref:VIT family protein n=1 Tax=Candidatus Gottesmanbacteria bacterium RBG_13_37_7 TaxID=1798369 RepID=A0A1F5YKY4_9BACT|nr:MAG: hypothetical protein A2Y99_05245 [Candidatus Gottesmanbacteria bacterium RBG_13_37_7]
MQISTLQPARFSFGTTSAVITILALITSLDTLSNAKAGIIGGILVMAIVDNISDTLGIHIHRETEIDNKKEVFLTTFINYVARLLVSLIFVLIIIIFPLKTAVYVSIVYGVIVLSAVSYMIATIRKVDPVKSTLQHLTVAILVIIASKILGKFLVNRFDM